MGAVQACLIPAAGSSTVVNTDMCFAGAEVPVATQVATAETATDAVSRLRRELPPGPVICVLGSTTFTNPSTEAIVVSCAGALQHLRHRVTFMTGGMNGVQKAFSQNCVGGNLFELLPIGSYGEIAHAHDLHAGTTLEQRQEVLALLGDIYLTLEGGPGVAREARIAHAHGALVIPVMSSGGASSGMFDFPKESFNKPSWARTRHWEMLHKKDADAAEVAEAVAQLAQSYLDKLEMRKSAENEKGKERNDHSHYRSQI